MRKTVYAVLIAAAAMLSPYAVQASSMAETAAATYKLYSGDRGICSVTFLGNDPAGALFLTAAHCVDAEGMNLRRQVVNDKFEVLSEQVIYVKAVKTIARKDIAVLQALDKDVKFPGTTVDFATVEEANKLAIGNDVMAVGYPAGEILAISKGEFTGKVVGPFKGELDAPMYQTTVPVAGGNSGGALYAKINDEWKLIGTTTGKRRDNDIMTYFQTAETVNEALRGFVKLPGQAVKAPIPTTAISPASGIDNR